MSKYSFHKSFKSQTVKYFEGLYRGWQFLFKPEEKPQFPNYEDITIN